MIPYGLQTIDDSDVDAVLAVLRSDWLTQGPAVADFEEKVAAYTGAQHAVAFANGTAALHAAVLAAGLGSGDRVATSSLSFVASANCARYVGADVVFGDIDPKTLNLDPGTLPECDALVAVHYAGLPIDLRALVHRPRVVIEDAAHAIGARTPDGPVGSCAHSDLCCFSFHPVKTITSAEGGMVTTNAADLAARLRRIRSHGMTPRPDVAPWAYEIDDVGFNYRLSDVHAALGASQLIRLDEFVARRNALAERYDTAFRDLDIGVPPSAPDSVTHGRHLYPVRVRDRAGVYAQLREGGVGAQVHYIPIHHQPLYADPAISLPETDAAYEELLSLPLFPGLTHEDQDTVISAVRAAIR